MHAPRKAHNYALHLISTEVSPSLSWKQFQVLVWLTMAVLVLWKNSIERLLFLAKGKLFILWWSFFLPPVWGTFLVLVLAISLRSSRSMTVDWSTGIFDGGCRILTHANVGWALFHFLLYGLRIMFVYVRRRQIQDSIAKTAKSFSSLNCVPKSSVA